MITPPFFCKTLECTFNLFRWATLINIGKDLKVFWKVIFPQEISRLFNLIHLRVLDPLFLSAVGGIISDSSMFLLSNLCVLAVPYNLAS